MHKIYIFLLVLFCGFVSQAQVEQQAQDTIKNKFSIGKVQLKDTQSILSAYTYDQLLTGTFIPIRLMGSLSIILLF